MPFFKWHFWDAQGPYIEVKRTSRTAARQTLYTRNPKMGATEANRITQSNWLCTTECADGTLPSPFIYFRRQTVTAIITTTIVLSSNRVIIYLNHAVLDTRQLQRGAGAWRRRTHDGCAGLLRSMSSIGDNGVEQWEQWEHLRGAGRASQNLNHNWQSDLFTIDNLSDQSPITTKSETWGPSETWGQSSKVRLRHDYNASRKWIS